MSSGYCCPELSLEPPEPVVACFCPVCGGEVYEGDTAWQKDGELICEWHLGRDVAQWLGWKMVEVGE